MMRRGLGSSFTLVLVVAILLSLSCQQSFAANKKSRPMTPEVAAKKENFRKQQEQRVTQPQRDTAAQSLKDKRLQVLRAKQAVRRSDPNGRQPNQ